MVREAVTSGAASSVNDLLRQVSNFRQYRPFNGILAVLQRPEVRHVLPAHEWRDRWRRTIRPHERPIVLLVPGGPVMFQYDVSQTEGNEDSRALPPELSNPYAMQDIQDADFALSWVKINAKHDGVRVSKDDTSWLALLTRSLVNPCEPTRGRTGRRKMSINFSACSTPRTAAPQLATLAHELATSTRPPGPLRRDGRPPGGAPHTEGVRSQNRLSCPPLTATEPPGRSRRCATPPPARRLLFLGHGHHRLDSFSETYSEGFSHAPPS